MPKDELARVIAEVASERLLGDPEAGQYANPTNMRGSQTTIAICSGAHCVERTASFELEENERYVETRTADQPEVPSVVRLHDRDRHAVLAQQPEDYLRFREIWTYSRRLITHTLVQAAEDVEVISEPATWRR